MKTQTEHRKTPPFKGPGEKAAKEQEVKREKENLGEWCDGNQERKSSRQRVLSTMSNAEERKVG